MAYPGGRRTALVVATVVLSLVALTALSRHDGGSGFWHDLRGRSSATAAAAPAAGGLRGTQVSHVTSVRTPDGGTLLTERVHGDSSGVTAGVLVLLPAGYATSKRSYPVMELLSGWHASPQSWISDLHLLEAQRSEERAGRLQPVITVIPEVNVATPRDVECTNVPHGPQAETWLTTDVRDLVLADYRALSGPHSWGVMGDSTGGYCAVKLALHRPGWYGSAAAMAGYFEALQDSTTGDLWGGSQAARDLNSPLWLVTHRRTPNIDVLGSTTRYDVESYADTLTFLRAARPPMRTFALVAPRGGHSFSVLAASLPQVLRWLSRHLAS